MTTNNLYNITLNQAIDLAVYKIKNAPIDKFHQVKHDALEDLYWAARLRTKNKNDIRLILKEAADRATSEINLAP